MALEKQQGPPLNLLAWLLGAVLILALLVWYSVYPPSLARMPYLLLRLMGLVLLLLSSAKLFQEGLMKNQAFGESAQNVLTSIFVTWCLLLVLEMGMNFWARPHGVGMAYAAVNWEYYYRELNSAQFREEEWELKDRSRPALVFLGDSFTEGAGIAAPQDRFANLLGDQVKDCYETWMLGKAGSNTLEQLKTLRDFQTPIHTLVWQYFGNDIESDARLLGHYRPAITAYQDLAWPLEALVRSSFLANFFYWLAPRDYLSDYSTYLLDCYGNDAIWQAHQQSLQALVDYCETHEIKLYVVLIPFLGDLELSERSYGQKVNQSLALSDSGAVQLVEWTEDLAAVPLGQRVINSNDPHASEQVHQIIADHLLKSLRSDCPN